MKYIAKPRLANNIGLKEFDDGLEAVKYLNEYLSPKDGDLDRFDYVFIAPSTSPKKLKKSIEEYSDMGKLIIVA